MSLLQLSKTKAADVGPFADKVAATVDADSFPVQLTARAQEMVREALEETAGEDGEILRVAVKGGGCAGLQYSLNFNSAEEVTPDDVLVGIGGILVVTDIFSATYLSGTDLDYVDTLQGAGFKFLNPNARRTCGCGSSFAA